MNAGWQRNAAVVGPLVLGLLLLAGALTRIDRGMVSEIIRIAPVLPLALVPSGAWHVLRTAAWHQSFPAGDRPAFARLFRLRLAAEAVSFLTITGVAGDPLKVVLLHREVPAATAAAAVALERIVYLVTTMAIVGVAAIVALIVLPLSNSWTIVFAAFVAATLLGALAITTSIRRWRRSVPSTDDAEGTSHSTVRRFIRALAGRIRQTAARDTNTLLRVAALHTIAFASMASEVWLALWLAGTPVTWTAAFAAETFTRVTSLAGAVVPAGLGVVEASNFAAATAIHVASGGLALALVRRVRGLLWCMAGFVVYPVPRRRDPASSAFLAPGLVVLDDHPFARPQHRLGGLPTAERIVRAAARAGFHSVLVWSPRSAQTWKQIGARGRTRIAIAVESDRAAWRKRVRLLDGDTTVVAIAPAIVASPAALVAAGRDDGETALAEGIHRVTPTRLESPDDLANALRTSTATPPLTFSVASPKDLREAEHAIRASIFKATDAHLASFNRRISIPISVALIRLTRMSANAMSALVLALGIWAGFLFSRGDYWNGVAAALISLAASILDGCDGELARLQYTESAFGCWVDTVGDYTYYIALFAGLTVGAVRSTGWSGFWWLGAALAAGLLLTFALLIVLRRGITGGRPERLNAAAKKHFYQSGRRWAWLVAKLSNCATRATMPYGVVVFALIGRLPALVVLGVIGTQIYWISLAVELRALLGDTPRSGMMNVRRAVGEASVSSR